MPLDYTSARLTYPSRCCFNVAPVFVCLELSSGNERGLSGLVIGCRASTIHRATRSRVWAANLSCVGQVALEAWGAPVAAAARDGADAYPRKIKIPKLKTKKNPIQLELTP